MTCDSCQHSFEISKGYHDKLPIKCPKCNKHKLYQDYSISYIAIKQEPKTLGHLAERNNKAMGKDQLEKKRAGSKWKPKKKPTWYNTEGKDLSTELRNVNTKEKKRKYIMEGKI